MGFLLALKRAISIVDAEGRVLLKFHGNSLEIEARGIQCICRLKRLPPGGEAAG